MPRALITGGTRGIGLAIADRFAQEGLSLGLIYEKNNEAAEHARQRLKSLGALVAIASVDVSDQAAVTQAITALETDLGGRFDTLVNNAGAVDDGLFLFTQEARIRRTLDVHLLGAMHTTRAVCKGMIKERSGVIINVISPSALRGRVGQSAYSAAKGALLAWTKTLAQELGPSGIRVNALCPGVIDTDIVRALPEKTRADLLAHVAMRRLGRPEEVAACASLLLHATYMHGAVLSADGGLR